MRTQLLLTQASTRLGGAAALAEDTRTVGEGVADGRSELPEDLAQVFFEVLVDADVLVVAEEAVRELGELRDVGVGAAVFPARREGEVDFVVGGCGGFGGGCRRCAGLRGRIRGRRSWG